MIAPAEATRSSTPMVSPPRSTSRRPAGWMPCRSSLGRATFGDDDAAVQPWCDGAAHREIERGRRGRAAAEHRGGEAEQRDERGEAELRGPARRGGGEHRDAERARREPDIGAARPQVGQHREHGRGDEREHEGRPCDRVGDDEEAHRIPSGQASWGLAFEQLSDHGRHSAVACVASASSSRSSRTSAGLASSSARQNAALEACAHGGGTHVEDGCRVLLQAPFVHEVDDLPPRIGSALAQQHEQAHEWLDVGDGDAACDGRGAECEATIGALRRDDRFARGDERGAGRLPGGVGKGVRMSPTPSPTLHRPLRVASRTMASAVSAEA